MLLNLRKYSFYFLLCISMLFCYVTIENSFISRRVMLGDVIVPFILLFYTVFSNDFRVFIRACYANNYMKKLFWAYCLCCLALFYGAIRVHFTLGYIPTWALLNKGAGFLILGSYFVVALYLLNRLDLKDFMSFFIKFFVATNLLILAYYILFGQVYYLIDLRCFSGSLRNTTSTSFFFMYVFIYIFFVRKQKEFDLFTDKKESLVLLFLFFLMLATHSRVGILTFLLFFVLILIPIFKGRLALIFILSCSIILWWIYRTYDSPKLFIAFMDLSDLLFFKPNPIPRELVLNDESMEVRLLIFSEASKLFFENPILGNGLGYYISTYYYHPDGYLGIHNTALWLITELGVFGLMVFILFYIRLLLPCYYAYKNNHKKVFIYSIAGHIVFVLFSLVQEILYQRILWVFFAVSVSWYYNKIKLLNRDE